MLLFILVLIFSFEKQLVCDLSKIIKILKEFLTA